MRGNREERKMRKEELKERSDLILIPLLVPLLVPAQSHSFIDKLIDNDKY